MRIIRRRRFLNDVTAAYAYLSNESPAAAEGFLEEVESLVTLLAHFPEIGRSRPELGVPFARFDCADSDEFYFIGFTQNVLFCCD